jgi:hypothetical protein
MQRSAPVGDHKSTSGADVVSARTESDADNIASVDKNAGLNAENGGSDAQRYEPAEADNVRTLLFLLAIGLYMMGFLIFLAKGARWVKGVLR